jgi:predicted dehydrogenase/type 1 glutamine amidotransferase
MGTLRILETIPIFRRGEVMGMSSRNISRRGFLGSAAMTLAGLAFPESILAQKEGSARPGPNDRIGIGVIGCGGRGRHLMNICKRFPDVDIVAVCDVDNSRLSEAVKAAGGKAAAYKDFRLLLENKDVDAVIVATPDHWHAICTVVACEMGKDVYVEKPLSHNIAEGRAMVNAARKHGRIVQMGTQQRSGAHYLAANELIRSGAIGKISHIRVWNVWNQSEGGTGSGRNAGIGNPPDGDPPPGVDYDMWLGPAPVRPFNPNRFHGNFYFFWDYSGGFMLAWTIHHIDSVHFATGNEVPISACSFGGKFVLEDNRETPDTQDAILEYPGYTLLATVHHANARPIEGRDYGIAFYGTRGTLVITREGFEVFPEAGRMQPMKMGGSEQDGPHVQNFLECIRSRKMPVADVETSHRSTVACHLANIAFRVKRVVRWDPERELIIGDEEANEFISRTYRRPWGQYLKPYIAQQHLKYFREEEGKMKGTKPLKAAIITGGHDFERDRFFEIFKGMPEVIWEEISHPDADSFWGTDRAKGFDLFVLYDMWQGGTKEQREAFAKLIGEYGKGLVALHHSVGSYQDWAEYTKIIGARYFLSPGVGPDGRQWDRSQFYHGQRFTVHISDKAHPITRGIEDFEIVDETYKGYWIDPSNHILLEVDHPLSERAIAWTREYGKGRVFFMQLGHDSSAYGNPSYREIVRRAMLWVCGRL